MLLTSRTVEGSTCHLPFVYKNVTYDECTMEDSDSLWCHTGGVDDNHQLVRGECQPGCASKQEYSVDSISSQC